MPQRVLVIATRRIGDVLLTTPLIRSLREAWPQAEIEVLVFEHTEGVLLCNPDIHRVITVPARLKFWKHLAFIASLFRRYDLAISTLTGDRPTIYAWLAGKMRIGMLEGIGKQRWKQSMLTRWAAFDNLGTHTVLMNLKLADVLGIPRSHEVVVAWHAEDEGRVARALPFDVQSESFAVLHVYPKFAYKMWRLENWAELARWLQAKGMRVVLTGGNFPDELAYVDQVFRTMPDAVNMAGKFSMAESAFLTSRASVYVGPDTMLTHVAAATGAPTVALFGPSNPVKWGPWPKGYDADHNPWTMKGTQRVNNVVLLQGEGDCVPCMFEGCERNIASLSDCLQNLPVASVIAEIQKLTARE